MEKCIELTKTVEEILIEFPYNSDITKDERFCIVVGNDHKNRCGPLIRKLRRDAGILPRHPGMHVVV